MARIRIATRRSRLALAQAEFVASRLKAQGASVELLGVTSAGDRDRSASLAGGKSSFVGALEEALVDGRADLAVHSMKDVAADVPAHFALQTFGPRADVRDALVGAASLAALPTGARVGTASVRRRALLLALRPDLVVEPVRGNVDTRLKRLDAGGCSALLLACAGIDRLGLCERIGQRIDPQILVPAPGQGALAAEFLAERQDLRDLLGSGIDDEVAQGVSAERTLTRQLGGDCAMPLGAHCVRENAHWRLTAVVADTDGSRVLRVELVGDDAVALGEEAARRLAALGVGELLGRVAQRHA